MSGPSPQAGLAYLEAAEHAMASEPMLKSWILAGALARLGGGS